MKKLIAALTMVLTGCGLFCEAGEMQCSGGKAEMCSASGSWTTWQDCGSIGKTCTTNPGSCSGYTGIACCR